MTHSQLVERINTAIENHAAACDYREGKTKHSFSLVDLQMGDDDSEWPEKMNFSSVISIEVASRYCHSRGP